MKVCFVFLIGFAFLPLLTLGFDLGADLLVLAVAGMLIFREVPRCCFGLWLDVRSHKRIGRSQALNEEGLSGEAHCPFVKKCCGGNSVCLCDGRSLKRRTRCLHEKYQRSRNYNRCAAFDQEFVQYVTELQLLPRWTLIKLSAGTCAFCYR